MSKRAVSLSIVLVTAGILFGAVLASGLGSLRSLFADASSVRFTTEPPVNPSEEVLKINKTFVDVAQAVTPSVVYITVKTKGGEEQQFNWPFGDMFPRPDDNIQRGSGSGIILTSDGYILTNRHVVNGATQDGINVTLSDSREFPATLVGSDEYTDIAVIKINAKDLTPGSLGNSDEVKVGEWVIAVGNPLGLTSTVTTGIVSAISRNIGISERRDGSGIENFIQTDAAINPGNSGGALVNLYGQVIGVNTAIASRTGSYIGYGFAVPINLAKVVANAIIKDGKFVRGYIGVNITTIDAKKAKALGLAQFHGVLVESVQEDGAGKAAGIEAGDVILEVNGKEVTSSNELQARVGMHKPGDMVALKIYRSGEYLTKNVKLKARTGEEETDTPTTAEKGADSGKDADAKGPLTFDKAGFTVQPLDENARKRYKVDKGVVVSEVKPYGRAFENNLRQNVVIFEVRKQKETHAITSVSDLKKILQNLKEGESVLLRTKDAQGNTFFIPLEGPAM